MRKHIIDYKRNPIGFFIDTFRASRRLNIKTFQEEFGFTVMAFKKFVNLGTNIDANDKLVLAIASKFGFTLKKIHSIFDMIRSCNSEIEAVDIVLKETKHFIIEKQ
jgi:hypothetical protein